MSLQENQWREKGNAWFAEHHCMILADGRRQKAFWNRVRVAVTKPSANMLKTPAWGLYDSDFKA